MIVDPDFFSHWRTRMVVDMLGGDELAPLYIMRLWAHCQNRKGDVFDIPPAGVKALCQFAGDAETLESALAAAEYMARDGATVTVIGWAEKNASLIAAWGNGHKGGRPKKNPEETQQKPMGNPEETQEEPSENPWKTHAKPIREEKRREEDKESADKPAPVSRLISLKTYLTECKAIGVKPVPDDHFIRGYCRDAGIEPDMVALAWLRFREEHTTGTRKTKRYIDWPGTFANAVKDRWYKLWITNEEGPATWTSEGLQARRVADAKAQEREVQHEPA